MKNLEIIVVSYFWSMLMIRLTMSEGEGRSPMSLRWNKVVEESEIDKFKEEYPDWKTALDCRGKLIIWSPLKEKNTNRLSMVYFYYFYNGIYYKVRRIKWLIYWNLGRIYNEY